MHALVARARIGDDVDSALRELHEETVPRVSQAPGFVAGYWTRKENTGLSMIIFESEDAANGAAERLQESPPQHVTIEEVELREVTAHA